MTYAELLKELIKISKLKSKDIATYIGYDNSYISKWTTEKNLPTPKTYAYINSKLAQLFAESIISQNAVDKLSLLTERKLILANKDIIYNVVACLLQQSYFSTIEKLNLPDLAVKDRKVFCGKEEIEEAFLDICGRVMATKQTSIRIISTNPLQYYVPILKKYNNIFYVTRDIPVKFLILLDPYSYHFEDSFKYILDLTLQFSPFHIDILEYKEPIKTQTLIIEDGIMLNFEYDTAGNPMFMFSSNDDTSLQTYQNQFKEMINTSPPILRTTNFVETELYTVRNFLNPGNKPVFYFSYLPAINISYEMAKSYIRKNKLSDDIVSKTEEIIKIYTLLFENQNCKIIFSERALYNCVINKRISLFNTGIQLSTSEMKDYLVFTKNFLADKENITYYLQEENGFDINFSDHRQSFVADNNSAIFTRDPAIHMNNSAKYLIFDSPTLSKKFYEYIHDQLDNKSFKPISREKVLQLIDRYMMILND